MQTRLGKHTVVLLGVGHTNAHVLRMWKMNTPKNAQLVCVSDFPIVTYSGMLPGVLAGQYPVEAMEIDLFRLASSAGVRVALGMVTGLDVVKKQLIFDDRPPLPFDILSIGIGSRPSFQGVDIADNAPLLAIKPMQTFLQRLIDLLTDVAIPNPKITIVGGGVGSIEIAFCLYERFYGSPKFSVVGLPDNIQPEFQIVTRGPSIGSGLNDKSIEIVENELESREIRVIADSTVSKVELNGNLSTNNGIIETDIVLWATGATGAPLLSQLGLEIDERGFLWTESDLRVINQSSIFAVGDTGSIRNSTTAKAGVFAVRQGPVLVENIHRLLTEKKELKEYQPQRDFLKLVNFGNGNAAAEYKSMAFQGRWCWWLKDRIDTVFMEKYHDYEPMDMPGYVGSDEPMKCLGCGGKVGSGVLSEVLSELQIDAHPDVKIGLDQPDDAAVISVHDNQVTATTDFFAAPFDDPYLIGRMAALNSASDCFVMGARPTTALAIVQLPEGHQRKQSQLMRELMTGSVEEFNRMRAAVVGGHTIEGPRTVIGFTVLGRQIFEPTTKAMLRPGDRLITTKPLGTGVLMAAWMQSAMDGRWFQPLVDSMLMCNSIAIELVEQFLISSITDVTGFGLFGHLIELMTASNISVEIVPHKIPVLPGCRELIRSGIESTLTPDNRTIANRVNLGSQTIESPKLTPFFDPQTCGGLLFGINESQAEAAIEFLHQSGFEDTAEIGVVTERSKTPELKLI